RWAVALRQARGGHRDHEQADRDVDPEDPLPRQALGDGPPYVRGDCDREGGDAAPRAEGDGPTLTGNRGRQDRQAQGRQDRATEALDAAGGDESLDVPGQRGDRRAAGEDRQSDDEQALAPEAVAER